MTPPALVGTVLNGKFQIEKALASGAAGDVYEATHLGLGSRVAVKVLRAGFAETADIRRKRFMREARVAARIQSDHVVRVFDIVAPEVGLTYIVMELLQGETLAERLRRAGAVAPHDAVDFIIQAAKPLAEMHDAGIVHRDVKPSNLFLARDKDGKERIKLLDFGVAAFQQPVARARGDSSLTLTEAVVGTPRYMAPEQVVAAKNVDARADVWALGVTLYELLAGAPPFDGKTVLAVLNQIEHQEPPLLSTTVRVSRELAEIVQSCLRKDPAMRPPDARALAAALSPFAETVSTVPSTRPVASSPPLPTTTLTGDARELPPRAVPASPLRTRRALLFAGAAFGGILVVVLLLSLSSRTDGASDASPRARGQETLFPVTASPGAAVPDALSPSPTDERAAASSAAPTSAPSIPATTPRRAPQTSAPPPRKAPAQAAGAKPAAKPAGAARTGARPANEDDDRIE